MKLSSFLSSSQKNAIKRIIFPILRITLGEKVINTRYAFTEFGNKECHTFFGYYDISPFQREKIIYLERRKDSNECQIVLNDIHNACKQYIATSRAWNWQQGVRLRWFPSQENTISFNDYGKGRYFNRIININTQEEQYLDWPLYDISPDGKFGITLDFERLGIMRPGYGYACKLYEACDLWKDGISIIDIVKNQLVKTITYQDISENIKKVDDVNSFYLNHLSFSPDGTKFLFFWINEDGGFHQASLGVYDILKDKLIPLETEGKASHYVWDGNDEIVCTVLDKHYHCGYFRFNLSDCSKTHICINSLKGDGHPSILKKGILLTDTYPDARGFQHIYLVDEKKDEKTEVMSIYSVPQVAAEMRTDLHPRLSDDRQYVSFDSNHNGLRRMLVLELVD